VRLLQKDFPSRAKDWMEHVEMGEAGYDFTEAMFCFLSSDGKRRETWIGRDSVPQDVPMYICLDVYMCYLCTKARYICTYVPCVSFVTGVT
jgi:hypothetical protein